MDCLSGWVSKAMQKLYFTSHILVLVPPNGGKTAKNIAKQGQKYKIVNLEAIGAFEVL